ncbi:hypothetical protein TWF569_010206 [Orbilia oligospora]|uniref:F-box domain-containing protein n=2 Tax=Orbilia oligospora TaxID=2813651 RepID=A0A7C8NWF6_ORBOL|nr:hypothetical protein TWF102_004208 [Orbilia oligospora]KAF3117738.1 hypothetical protein TWF103_004418 [Orbilia oligospora]KAF3134326.1 hypothetical protein TWF569_010206 [Orbilia oligospora]KAF3142751.1 hypothetical protein TWF703_000254 [Orbilia oligospora]
MLSLLLACPAEICQEIFSYLDGGKNGDLAQLSQVSKDFRELVLPTLFRCIKLRPGHELVFGDGGPLSSVRPYVRHFCLDRSAGEYGDETNAGHVESIRRSTEHFDSYPSITHIDVSWGFMVAWNARNNLYKALWARISALPNLKSLRLVGYNPSPDCRPGYTRDYNSLYRCCTSKSKDFLGKEFIDDAELTNEHISYPRHLQEVHFSAFLELPWNSNTSSRYFVIGNSAETLKKIVFSGQHLRLIGQGGGPITLIFPNVVELCIGIWGGSRYSEWHALAWFAKSCPNVQKLLFRTLHNTWSFEGPLDNGDLVYDELISMRKLKEVIVPWPVKFSLGDAHLYLGIKAATRYKRRELAGVIRCLARAGLNDLEKVTFERRLRWPVDEYKKITKTCKITRGTETGLKLSWTKLHQSILRPDLFRCGEGKVRVVASTNGEENGADSGDDIDENPANIRFYEPDTGNI